MTRPDARHPSAAVTGLSVPDALAAVMSRARALPAEEVGLEDALGRVLAEPVTSRVHLPPWDNSGMDGYAVRAADVRSASAEAPVRLIVTGTIAAGDVPAAEVTAGTAMRIMTGAPLPAGADAVIRIEDTDGGEAEVRILDARDADPPSRNVRRRGEDLAPGTVAVAAGAWLGPAQLGVLASVGAARVRVHRRPRVAILATGDELVGVEGFAEVEAGRRIVSSNSYTLAALVRETGAEAVSLGIAPDDPAAIRALLERGRECDLMLTTGGVSVGAFDYTRGVLAAMGASLDLWRVRMRPGAPLGFGMLGDVPWLGLPGNPVSAMVTFELFARPLLRRMLGYAAPYRATTEVVLDEPVSIAAPLTHFLRAIVTQSGGEQRARLTGGQGSGLLTSMARANALLVIAPERQSLAAGERVPALLLGPSHGWSDVPPA